MHAGPATQDVIVDLFCFADVIVSPHMGRALGEAALAAAPIVAYNLDWRGELITDGENGRLISAGKIQAFTQVVAALLASPDEERGLGRAARQGGSSTAGPSAAGFR